MPPRNPQPDLTTRHRGDRAVWAGLFFGVAFGAMLGLLLTAWM